VDGANSQWTISGTLYFAGTINGDGGTGLLTVTNGGMVSASTIHVYKSGTLTGNATVSTTSGTTVDGTVAPNGGGGTLNFGGSLQLNSAAATQCKVTPQDPSTTPQVSVSAQVSLGGRLSVTMTGDFSSAPTRFTLLYADSVAVGHITFGSTSITYPTGQGCWVPQITYDYSGGHVRVYLDRVINCN
jgi:T5SS/PEP-CTERM-associated repeat protein